MDARPPNCGRRGLNRKVPFALDVVQRVRDLNSQGRRNVAPIRAEFEGCLTWPVLGVGVGGGFLAGGQRPSLFVVLVVMVVEDLARVVVDAVEMSRHYSVIICLIKLLIKFPSEVVVAQQC